jgi:hypothetical protein
MSVLVPLRPPEPVFPRFPNTTSARTDWADAARRKNPIAIRRLAVIAVVPERLGESSSMVQRASSSFAVGLIPNGSESCAGSQLLVARGVGKALESIWFQASVNFLKKQRTEHHKAGN